MTQTFHSPSCLPRKSEFTLDGGGISECRQGNTIASIPWEEVRRLETGEVRDLSGSRIKIRLTLDRAREFHRLASGLWRERFPERWRENEERLRRQRNRAVYFWIPLFMLGPCLAGYASIWIFSWVFGWPAEILPELRANLQPHYNKLDRLTAIFAALVGALMLWHFFASRKSADSATEPRNLSQR